VRGHTVVPSCGPEYADRKFYTCPIADASQLWVHDLISTWRLCRVDGITLAAVIPEPSSALLHAIQAVDAAVSEAHALDAKRRSKDSELELKASAHQRQWR
tara:strand:- start:1453 stop:1755 length:303 start_codon:yes stop_codon:yes gene_type:complete